MSIYVTGDTHGYYSRLIAATEKLKEGDTLIVCGDWGYLLENNRNETILLDDIERMPYSILFVDGNHENFPAIYAYPEEEWNGGKIHRIRKNIAHLERGQVFSVEGLKIFTFGGGYSLDKATRKEGVDWWKEEMPTYEEMDEGKRNLEKCDFEVDYIFTHTINTETVKILPMLLKGGVKPLVPEELPLNCYLEDIRGMVKYKKWFFGHFHNDVEIPLINQRMIYFDVIKIN